MATLKVFDSGPLTTIQDVGRFGLRAFGVSQAGPMDRLAFELANRLVGNSQSAAAIEFALFGGRFRFDVDTIVAVTGPDVELTIDGTAMATKQSLKIGEGQDLRIGPVRNGLWGYLAIAGGIETPPVLGSRSTHLRFGLGGHEGRALIHGDYLPLASPDFAQPIRVAGCDLPELDYSPIRVILGPQDDYFDSAVIAKFLNGKFRISTQVDRMATVLDGTPLFAARGHDIISDGTMPGAIQVPGSGQPLILMAESQTTGGYPKIATIIGADLRRIAQSIPGQVICFSAVTPEEAEAALLEYSSHHEAILNSVHIAKNGWAGTTQLLNANLISGVWAHETGNE